MGVWRVGEGVNMAPALYYTKKKHQQLKDFKSYHMKALRFYFKGNLIFFRRICIFMYTQERKE